MKYGVYCIRDAVTGFLSPTIDMNNASAVRNFDHAMMQSQSIMHTHPEDYALVRIGSFDSETGVLRPEEATVLKQGVREV